MGYEMRDEIERANRKALAEWEAKPFWFERLWKRLTRARN